MSTPTAGRLDFTVSGPEIDKAYETPGIAMSAAITFAEHSKTPVTLYVRDAHGDVLVRVERDEHRRTTVRRAKAFA
jgi:hypothetical protein